MHLKNLFKAKLIAFTLFFISSIAIDAQINLTATSSTGYTVNIEILPVAISTNGNCTWGYNYNLVLEYSMTFSGSNIPSGLYFISGSIGCGNNSHFFILPSSGGTGTVNTLSNQWRPVSDCSTATPESLNCGNVQIQLIGLGLPYQTLTGVIDYDSPPLEPPVLDVSWNGTVSDSWNEATNW